MSKTILSIRNINNSNLVTATNGYYSVEFSTKSNCIVLLLCIIKIHLWKRALISKVYMMKKISILKFF